MVLTGPDVSAFQGQPNWDQVKSSGASLTLIKLTEGSAANQGYVNADFSYDWDNARRVGLVRGAYHFARPEWGNSPDDEARFFLSRLPALQPGDLVALDMETPTDYSMSAADLSAWALRWLAVVQAALGFKPLCYSYPDYILHNLTDARLAAYPLWLAAYQNTCPPAIGPWPVVTLWQHTASAHIPGIYGIVDEDEIARSVGGLEALGKPTSSMSFKNFVLTVAMHVRSAPDAAAAEGRLLPAGTKVVELTPPDGGAVERQDKLGRWWAYCRDGGDVAWGWLLMSNMQQYTP